MKPKHIIQVVAHINYLLFHRRIVTKIMMQKIHQIVCWMILLALIVLICITGEIEAVDDQKYESGYKFCYLPCLVVCRNILLKWHLRMYLFGNSNYR